MPRKSGPFGFGFLPDIRPTKFYGTERRVLDKNRLMVDYPKIHPPSRLEANSMRHGYGRLYSRGLLKSALMRQRPDWKKLPKAERDDLYRQAIDFIEAEVGWTARGIGSE